MTFVDGDVLSKDLFELLPRFDSAFLDPDWAISGPSHVYRFTNSNTCPPADSLLRAIFTKTQDEALVLPPRVDARECEGLSDHECQRLILRESHELYCLYFGRLAKRCGRTTLHV